MDNCGDDKKLDWMYKSKGSDSDSDVDSKIAKKLKYLKEDPLEINVLNKHKQKSKDNVLDTILMHKFNQLKDKLSQEDLNNILADSASDSEEESMRLKKKLKKHKRQKSSSSEYSDYKHEKKSKRKRGTRSSSKDYLKNLKKLLKGLVVMILVMMKNMINTSVPNKMMKIVIEIVPAETKKNIRKPNIVKSIEVQVETQTQIEENIVVTKMEVKK
ncbi:hypothetical protein NQ314_009645 [Rhamnusium bicolor]|uniref:Uncharacterized protein n=1 Tax=Rhamnusium bicolor TaxID=1586634 RepID=A0AAV8XXP3_9CUCU|nr:hypothetical protein NQ314_009645 [Rhamnusium bicolor]